jgi:hypothetical protein
MEMCGQLHVPPGLTAWKADSSNLIGNLVDREVGLDLCKQNPFFPGIYPGLLSNYSLSPVIVKKTMAKRK